MVGRLDHVAIAVPDLASAARKYRDLLGAEVGHPQPLPEHGVTVVAVTLEPAEFDGALIELEEVKPDFQPD